MFELLARNIDYVNLRHLNFVAQLFSLTTSLTITNKKKKKKIKTLRGNVGKAM